jgi:general secretion pathway protein G
MGRIRAALETYRQGAASRFPTTKEGLAALSSEASLLDELGGFVPNDPWGHPYHYASPHPTKPDEIDLRSAGPDGEIDTEDDVFPESR